MDTLERLAAGQTVFLQIAAYVEMRRRVWPLGKSVVVVTKDPSLPIQVSLILEPGINYLQPRPFRSAMDSETIVDAKKFPISQLDGGEKAPSDNIVVSTLSLLKMEASPDRHYGVSQKKIQQIAERVGRVLIAALIRARQIPDIC